VSVELGYAHPVLGSIATWPGCRFLFPFVPHRFVHILGKRRGHHRRIFKSTFRNSYEIFCPKHFQLRKSGDLATTCEIVHRYRQFDAHESNHTFSTQLSSAKVDLAAWPPVANAMADGLWHTLNGNVFDDMRASRQLFSFEVNCIFHTFSDRRNSHDADPFLRGISSQPQLQKGQGCHNFGFHGTQLGTGAADPKLERIVGQPFGSHERVFLPANYSSDTIMHAQKTFYDHDSIVSKSLNIFSARIVGQPFGSHIYLHNSIRRQCSEHTTGVTGKDACLAFPFLETGRQCSWELRPRLTAVCTHFLHIYHSTVTKMHTQNTFYDHNCMSRKSLILYYNFIHSSYQLQILTTCFLQLQIFTTCVTRLLRNVGIADPAPRWAGAIRSSSGDIVPLHTNGDDDRSNKGIPLTTPPTPLNPNDLHHKPLLPETIFSKTR